MINPLLKSSIKTNFQGLIVRSFFNSPILRDSSNGMNYGNKDQSIISQYTIDLTEKAKKGKIDPVIGREEEIRRAIHILSRRTKNNPVLIGEAGVGKTAVVEVRIEVRNRD